jgi:hypothetical protein
LSVGHTEVLHQQLKLIVPNSIVQLWFAEYFHETRDLQLTQLGQFNLVNARQKHFRLDHFDQLAFMLHRLYKLRRLPKHFLH